MVVAMPGVAFISCAFPLHHDRHLHLAGVLEDQRQRVFAASRQRLLQAEQHHMMPTRGELYRRPGGDLDTVDFLHLHHVILVYVFMQFRMGSDRGMCGSQAVAALTPVLDDQIRGTGRCDGRQSAGPGVQDMQIP